MDFQSYCIYIFLGLIGFSWLSYQTCILMSDTYRPTSQWFRKHVFLPRVLRDHYLFNPTRAEVGCLSAHWAFVIFFNTYRVSNRGQAASRAAYASMAHLLPLVLSGQLSFASDSFGLSPPVGLKFHKAFGFMAVVQGIVHSFLRLIGTEDWVWSAKLGTLAISSVVLLSFLPIVSSRAYELFMVTHQVLTIVASVALWLHVRSQVQASRLCFVTLFTFLASSLYRYARQIHRNLALRNGIKLIRIQEARKHNECLMLTLRVPTRWKVCPGQHVFLTILSMSCASIFQRHPFTITWWEVSQETLIHLMIRTRRGWTKSVSNRAHLLGSHSVWLDGPYGLPLYLENYGTVILIASGDGIFAQLPYLKALTEAYKISSARTSRIKLVWLTNEFNGQLQGWIQTILNDDDLPTSLLDICIHKPNATISSKVESLGRRLKVIHDIPNVRSYLRSELRHLETEIAVTLSAHQILRSHVRDEILKITKFRMRLFELDYQPNDEGQFDGGVAV